MSEKENLTKNYIFKAFHMLLQTNNYDKISICDITNKAGVSRMSFYRNFKSKEDLFYNWLGEIFNRIHKKVEESGSRTQYSVSKAIFEEFRPLKDCIKSFKCSSLSNSFSETVREKFSKEIPNDYMNKTSKYIPIFYMGALSSTLLSWLTNGAKEDPEDMAKLIASLVDDI